jgi:predicted RNA binding protein YcfA (HicA-like mRNA interferase family)
MTLPPDSLRRLRNKAVRELIRALERDRFIYRRSRGSGRVYRHADGRRVIVHYHSPGDTLPLGTLRSIVSATRWNEEDLRTLGLI